MHIHILQLCVIQAAASYIYLEPRNVSVLRGSEVRFNCSTTESWDVMNWRLGEDTILVISVDHGLLSRSESVSTVNHSMTSLTVWELILSNSSFSQTVQEIRCELLPKNLKSSSALFVQESSSENKASSYSSWTDNLSSERRSVADETSGKVNLGYHTEDITSSGHSDLENRADSTIYISSSPQVPDIVIFSSQNQEDEDFSNLYSNSAKKTVRQVTTV
ncbi:immunoglobulin superfamily member 5 isoform X4 [Danio rerio]|uniref:immunoglobulin superfamily member 5 isoform X4 n=1 Tax=Danio rerio TaxID=7955 RepID=UPI003CE46395